LTNWGESKGRQKNKTNFKMKKGRLEGGVHQKKKRKKERATKGQPRRKQVEKRRPVRMERDHYSKKVNRGRLTKREKKTIDRLWASKNKKATKGGRF